MKKIIFLLIFCFVSSIFAVGMIEIVPRPVHGVVGTKKIIVRGINFNNNNLRIQIQSNGSPIDYLSPIILNDMADVINYPNKNYNVNYKIFYLSDIEFPEEIDTITIKLEEFKNNNWETVATTPEIKYEYNSPDAMKSLWGRIANDFEISNNLNNVTKNHVREEQRAVFFYPGTRFPISVKEKEEPNRNLIGNNLSPQEIANINFISQITSNMLNISGRHYGIKLFEQNGFLRKDGIDTKGPGNSDQKCWSSKDRINAMMEEIDDANANILIFVYWSDHYATLGDDPELNIVGDFSETEKNYIKSRPDNYWKIYPAPTFPETCDYRLAMDTNFCVFHSNKDYLIGQNDAPKYSKIFRTLGKCPCNPSQNTIDPVGNPLCDEGSICKLGGCFKTCDNNGCGWNETCICAENDDNNNCIRHVCIDNNLNNIWTYYYYYEKENCEAIYTPDDYDESEMSTNRQFDAIDQMFKAAKDKGLLVVPTIESNQFYPFCKEFPHKLAPVKQTIQKMLEKYGNYSNWLKIYDKNGVAKRAIMISQALGVKEGNYKRYPKGTIMNDNDIDENDDDNIEQNDDDFENIVVDSESYNNALEELAEDFNVAFLLDNTSMPDDPAMTDFFTPDVTDLLKIGDNLLGVSIFGYPFDEMLKVINNEIYYYDATMQPIGFLPQDFKPLEVHMILKSIEWLNNWRMNTQDDDNFIPLVANVIPGFDDRWRGVAGFPFSIYGDNSDWYSKMATLAFFYNTAGINLAIWNGYGEGYVWVPYRKRAFQNNYGYSINENFNSGLLEIPESYANLNFSSNGIEPIYEKEVVNDNYCFAQYLFEGDDDGDCIPNNKDNCQDDANSMELNFSEIVLAQCDENGVGGAKCMEHTKGSTYKDNDGNWHWQPDHDLDGTGDACDSYTVWTDFREIPTGNSKVEKIVQNSQEEHGYIRKNETLSVTVNMNKSDLTPPGVETATTRYCWLPEDEKNSWGLDGYCTTEAGHTLGECKINFGYSHGTDPKPTDNEGNPNWKFIKQQNNYRESDEFTEIETNKNKTITWNWRHDFKYDRFLDIGTSLDTAPECRQWSYLGTCIDSNISKFYYTMSTGVHSGDMEATYIVNNQINPNFFKNQHKYARSSRLSLDAVEISYYKEFYMKASTPPNCFSAGCNFQMEWIHDMIIEELLHGPRPYEMTAMEHYFKNAYGSDLINTGVAFREWNNNAVGMPSVVEKSRPLLLLTITKNASGMNEGILAVQNNTIFSLRNIQEAVSSNFTFEIVTMDANSNGDWRTQGILDVSNIPNFMPITSTYHNRDLYVVSKNGGNTAHIYKIDKTDQTITPTGRYNFCFHPIPIHIPIHKWTLTDLTNITIHSVGNSLLALGKTTSGMKVYKLSEQNGNPYFEDISGTILPEGRDVYNVEIQEDVLYLAGGAGFGENSADLKTDIWRFTETDGWQLIRNDINMFPVTLRIDFDGDNIILTDRVIRLNGTTNRAIFPADGTGDIVIETVPVEGANVQGFGDYCLAESENTLAGGLETSGECVPFTHPWYSSFSAGATVYSLDGKGNRLYVGTNNAIKVYDISDPTSPVLVSSFSTGSRVNDFEVYGNTLFAATNGGLYKLDASNDTLTQTLFVSAFLNYQYKVEVYNGKLYVGEDNGIKVRDLDTMSVLTSVNNGSVLDFAIENGEIGIYKDALFSPVEIRDAETLTLKANEFFGCFEIEVGSSDGRFYLSCDDETYRFEDDGDGGISFTELSGDIRELQDVYTFDGYTYFYDENTIWISTSSDVPAICGNGMVEGDEVCDGGQIDCEELDSNYVSGTATCNSTCDGYNTNNCSDDGW